MAWLLVIADREALAWVLRERCMAFGRHRAREARALAPGERVFIYTTRGCFRNPTRDRGRIIADASVASRATDLDPPLELGGRAFVVACPLRIPCMTPLRAGVELAPLLPRLHSFAGAANWRGRMRHTLVSLVEADVSVISSTLRPMLQPRDAVLAQYVAAARPPSGDGER
jgi:hypothetical protein